jgi:methionyl-tRNA formyltransferase
MRVVFFGTPDFAVSSLERLIKSPHDVAAVVTAPDKERGRGRKLSYTPVKEFAVENNLKVLQPAKLNDENFISELKQLQADIFVVIAFRILPVSVYTIPPHGSFNLHGSLLPRYRGAAPIQWALINGDKETGVTTFFLKEKVDTGNMILQENIAIEDSDDLGTLYDKMKSLGAELIIRTIDLIEQDSVSELQQDDSLATPAPKITKELCLINWNKSAEKIHNLIRGLSPVPCAYFIQNDKRYKIYKSKVVEDKKLNAGEISVSDNKILAGCGDAALDILEIQPEGRKRLSAEEFLRGYQF